MWRESDHPRRPAGDNRGGEFTHASGVELERARSAEAAGQSGQVDDGELPGYGEARDGAVEVQAHHFSQAERTTLDSSFYGQGGRGIERNRLEYADPSIRSRTYFYVNEGGGVQPEQSVGSHEHVVKLRNLYEPSKDGFAVWRSGTGDRSTADAAMNAAELAVKNAGYDGYYIRGRLNTVNGAPFGVAVVLGKHHIPVKSIGVWRSSPSSLNRKAPVQAPPQVRFPYAGKKP